MVHDDEMKARFRGGPIDGEIMDVETPARPDVFIPVNRPLAGVMAEGPISPTALAPRAVRYERFRYYGPYAYKAPLVYDYRGPSAYRWFVGPQPISPEFSTRAAAREWLSDQRRVAFFEVELRWVYPGDAHASTSPE
jgi:hypothetical protein